jgi:hypothetical protein
MSENLNDIPSPFDYQKRLKNLLFFLQRDYSSLVNGRNSEREKKLCAITKELDFHYHQTKNSGYKKVKEQALIRYSEIVMNCKRHGSRYGGLKE